MIPLLERILPQDAANLDAVLRLATAQSSLGRDAEALAAFKKAASLAPRSPMSGCISRFTTRAARNGSRRCRCSNRC